MSMATTSTPVIDPARAAESNTATLITVLTIFHAIALVFVSLRVYARAFVIKTFGKDDIFMVLSAVRSPLNTRPWPHTDHGAAVCNRRMECLYFPGATRARQAPGDDRKG
jgi:hypothetical protein